MEKKLFKSNFSQWVKMLKGRSVYAPQVEDKKWYLRLIDNPDKVDLNFPQTVQSAKSIIFPQREVLFKVNKNNHATYDISESLPNPNEIILFGIRPCDARALTLTDKVFGHDFPDPYYQQRRHNAVIIGLSCPTPPGKNCFCLSTGGDPFSTDGLDMLMTDMGKHYVVETFSAKGEKLIHDANKLFAPLSPDEINHFGKTKESTKKQLSRQLHNPSALPQILKEMFDSPFWDENAKSCIRCGICTYLCPTCHCFDINDEVSTVSPLAMKRVRTWDTCQFPDFTMHSSGHNPRPSKSSRLRQRILHKYYYFFERYGQYQCTGCGRCVSQCPVGIDIIDLLNKVNHDSRQ